VPDVLKNILANILSDVSNDVQPVGHATLPGHTGTGEASTLGYVMNASIGPMRKPGPAIHLPGYPVPQDTPPTMQLQNRMAQPVGYTAAHAMYPAIQNERIREAYSTYNAEVVVIDVRLVVKLPGKVKESLIHVGVFAQRLPLSNIKINSRIVLKLLITYPCILGLLN
jgi:hypothetical protein